MNSRRSPGRKPYLSPTEVAEMMMVSPITVRQWAQRGDLPAFTTPGGHRRFLIEEVENFARRRGLTLQRTGDGQTRILVVDDDEQFGGFICELLKHHSEEINVERACDGFEAGQKIEIFQPHIMILDLMMPGLNGFEVCRRLKSVPATAHIRVIAMTGHPTRQNIERILSAGAEVCLGKPIEPPQLLKALQLEAERKTASPAQ